MRIMAVHLFADPFYSGNQSVFINHHTAVDENSVHRLPSLKKCERMDNRSKN
jgi:hypothetical protein